MNSVAAAIVAAAQALATTSDTARLDAEVLMAHALGVTRSDLILRHMREPAAPGFAALVERRLAHEPVAYITGHQEFWGLDFAVGPAVLIPRGDSEVLIEAALAHPAPRRVIDLGTGSGALLLAALHEWPQAQGIGIDRSAEALATARGNAVRLGLDARATMLAADWHQPGWAADLGRFDLVLANPPYVETDAVLDASVRNHEPHGALFAGAEGLDDYRVILPQLAGLLAPGGIALVEIGWTQAEPVTALARAAGLTALVHPDLAGRPRAVALSAVTGIDQIPGF
jgi:release factor glutamine methyltransferase